ncbi:hypothetical protein K504DRAFT_490710 [Pleomassaria siparia CBS 279.74]|uniref:Uncharacterized protein n=1 Tax=Pleomassaria siparia CBS 279.74 TaxID=1314801 RepID=A0A6G1KDT0_9PLEO|nr:hypothetical protein K504DRAFT_490710 [Pleomassaria siparia CBS 279.74]
MSHLLILFLSVLISPQHCLDPHQILISPPFHALTLLFRHLQLPSVNSALPAKIPTPAPVPTLVPVARPGDGDEVRGEGEGKGVVEDEDESDSAIPVICASDEVYTPGNAARSFISHATMAGSAIAIAVANANAVVMVVTLDSVSIP